MKKISVLLVIILSVPVIAASDDAIADAMKRIKWLGGAAMTVESRSGVVIHVDLADCVPSKKGDILLYTHPHGDHYLPRVIEDAAKEGAVIAAPFEIESGKRIKSGETFEVKGISITAVPAYNIKKAGFHPKENGWVGYVITVDGVRMYVAGDTERVPEMKDVKADIAFIPLGQTYTMSSVKEAAQAAVDTGAKIAVPIHWGNYEGTIEDTVKFEKLLKGKVKVIRMRVE